MTPAALLARISIPAIEAHEGVEDLLGAAPLLPFGHLNRAWQTFLASVQPSDEIWTFAAEWTH